MVLNNGDVKLHGIIPVWVAEKLHVIEGLTLEYQRLGQAVERCCMNCGNEKQKHSGSLVLNLGGLCYSCVGTEG